MKNKFFEWKTETSQGYIPKWSTIDGGRYQESEEFKIVTWEYKVLRIKGVVFWATRSKIIDETKWFTTETFAEELGYKNNK